ncbi:glycosyltransferase [Parasediminibacterium sp. JCM 36343]|uniref:glycosyltransferase n=1 Tax=Parasediminibacterium sp. JCM 36343 TaxID=3374279 RepID=UPI0039790590
MYIFIGITYFLFLLYAAVMLMYRHWFIKLSPFEPKAIHIPNTSFSIIIPARNEADNIGLLLQSIINQNYPANLWEVIVIDDFSTDATAQIVGEMGNTFPNIHLIELAKQPQVGKLNAYKKKAIETGIGIAKNNWIMTTDADCVVGKEWLSTYDAYIQENNPVFVGGPVAFTNDGSVLQTFQCIDFMALQGITAAAASTGTHSMSNGANLAYKKETFIAVDGFKGIDDIASGDDMLLMNKIKQAFPKKMGYVFSAKAIVYTAPMQTLNSFLNQRIRWASKTNKYKEASVIVVLWMVLLLNISLVLMPFLSVFFPPMLGFWLLLMILKTWVEASFAVHIAAFFSIPLHWKDSLLQVPHILYTSLAGCFGILGKYQWKDRKVQ